jgi:hypothetical protein
VDNGSMFIDAGLRRACAVLGIKLTGGVRWSV